MRWRWVVVAIVAAVVAHAMPLRADPSYPPVVFLLLDTTRARIASGAWGHHGDTTPVLDGLARTRRSASSATIANSHATRPSMPQLMSGALLSRQRPRAVPGRTRIRARCPSRAPTRRRLAPAILLRRAGYATAGRRARTRGCRPDSELGRGFDQLRTAAVHDRGGARRRRSARRPGARASGRAAIGRAPCSSTSTSWTCTSRDGFPRASRCHPVPGYDWRSRFRPNGEADFRPRASRLGSLRRHPTSRRTTARTTRRSTTRASRHADTAARPAPSRPRDGRSRPRGTRWSS